VQSSMVGNQETQIKNLLDMISAFRDWNDHEELYRLLREFFHKTCKYEALGILSIPIKSEKTSSKKKINRSVRLVWSEDEKKTLETAAFLVDALTPSPSEKKKGWKKDDSKQRLYLFLGEAKGQTYCLAVSGFLTNQIEDETLDYLSKFIENTFYYISKINDLDKLKGLVHIDDVTGLYNQRKLSSDIQSAIQKHSMLGQEFSVLFIDIDHFKNINDKYGHIVGTKLLIEVSKILQDKLRESDLVYRYGGDEFIMIVPNSDVKVAKIIGERILKAISQHAFKIDQAGEIHISVSIGVAIFPHDARDKEEILNIADVMMYQAKKGGRGRVCHAGEIVAIVPVGNAPGV